MLSAPVAGKPFNVGAWKRFARRLGKNPDLEPAQIEALRNDIKLLIDQRKRWRRLTRVDEVRVDRRTTVLRRRRAKDKRKYKGRLRGSWMIDPRSHGPCPVCKRPLPHPTKVERNYHFRYLKAAHGRAKITAMMLAGVHRPWEHRNIALRSAMARAKRIRTFEEEAAHVASVLGPARVAEIVAAYGNGYDYPRFRQWIRVRYGAGPKDKMWGIRAYVAAKRLTSRPSGA